MCRINAHDQRTVAKLGQFQTRGCGEAGFAYAPLSAEQQNPHHNILYANPVRRVTRAWPVPSGWGNREDWSIWEPSSPSRPPLGSLLDLAHAEACASQAAKQDSEATCE